MTAASVSGPSIIVGVSGSNGSLCGYLHNDPEPTLGLPHTGHRIIVNSSRQDESIFLVYEDRSYGSLTFGIRFVLICVNLRRFTQR